MAINKKKASPIVKIGIWVISGALVLSFTLPLLADSLSANRSGTGSAGTQGQLDALAAQYGGTVTSLEQSLASDPTSYTVLVSLGNTYFDWGIATQQATQNVGGAAPMWNSAVIYYDRALEAQPGDPNVSTDAAISHYYAGDVAGAVEIIDSVVASNPDFAPGHFNAAIFYEAAGRSADAIAAANKAMELDPQGQSGDQQVLKDIVARLSTSASEATGAP